MSTIPSSTSVASRFLSRSGQETYRGWVAGKGLTGEGVDLVVEVGGGVPQDLAEEAMTLAQQKLPIKTKILVREDVR